MYIEQYWCFIMGSSWFRTLDHSFCECLWEVQSGKRKAEKKKKRNAIDLPDQNTENTTCRAKQSFNMRKVTIFLALHLKVPSVSVKLAFICVIYCFNHEPEMLCCSLTNTHRTTEFFVTVKWRSSSFEEKKVTMHHLHFISKSLLSQSF